MNNINDKKNFEINKYCKKNNKKSIGIIEDIIKILSYNLIRLIAIIIARSTNFDREKIFKFFLKNKQNNP